MEQFDTTSLQHPDVLRLVFRTASLDQLFKFEIVSKHWNNLLWGSLDALCWNFTFTEIKRNKITGMRTEVEAEALAESTGYSTQPTAMDSATNTALAALAKKKALCRLKYLRAVRLDSKTLVELMENNPSVSHISAISAGRLDTTFNKAASPNLTVVQLRNCTVSPALYRGLVASCPRLRYLDLLFDVFEDYWLQQDDIDQLNTLKDLESLAIPMSAVGNLTNSELTNRLSLKGLTNIKNLAMNFDNYWGFSHYYYRDNFDKNIGLMKQITPPQIGLDLLVVSSYDKITINTTSLMAIADGKPTTIESLLAQGANINAYDFLLWSNRRNIFQARLQIGPGRVQVDLIKVMAKAGLNFLHRDSNGFNCFHYAVMYAVPDVQSYMLGEVFHEARKTHSLDEIINPGKDGKSLLHLVASEPHQRNKGKLNELFKPEVLIDQFHIDVNCRDSKGRTPLHLAESKTIISRLLAAGASPAIKDFSGKTSLEYLLRGRHRHCLENADLLISHNPDYVVAPAMFTEVCRTPFAEAIDLMRTLLIRARSTLPEEEFGRCLACALEAAVHHDVLRLAKLRKQSFSQLRSLVDLCSVMACGPALEAQATIKVVCQGVKGNLLHAAMKESAENNVVEFDMLFALGVSPSEPDALGKVPLFYATNIFSIDWIYKKTQTIDVVDPSGTPLVFYLVKNFGALSKAVELGASLTRRDASQRTILMEVAKVAPALRVFRHVLERIVNTSSEAEMKQFLNLPDNSGRTLVHYLVEYVDLQQHELVPYYLIESGLLHKPAPDGRPLGELYPPDLRPQLPPRLAAWLRTGELPPK